MWGGVELQDVCVGDVVYMMKQVRGPRGAGLKLAHINTAYLLPLAAYPALGGGRCVGTHLAVAPCSERLDEQRGIGFWDAGECLEVTLVHDVSLRCADDGQGVEDNVEVACLGSEVLYAQLCSTHKLVPHCTGHGGQQLHVVHVVA